MKWKFLSVALLGLTVIACEKKEEKKAEDASPPADAMKVEEPKPAETAPAETPNEEPKPAETPNEEPKPSETPAEEKKAS